MFTGHASGLNLFDGTRIWKKSKGSGLYLAGVFGESVVVVGTRSVMAYALAEQYRSAGLCRVAIPYYHALFELAPTANRGYNGLAACLLLTGQVEEARRQALAGIRVGANVPRAREILGLANEARHAGRSFR